MHDFQQKLQLAEKLDVPERRVRLERFSGLSI